MARSIPARLLILATLALGGCAGGGLFGPPAGPPGAPWVSEFGRGHPLTGRIWQPAAGRFAEPEAVLAALQGARFVMLGEKHDNADHHRIQAWLVGALIARGRAPAVAFEMLTGAQAAPLAAHLAAHPGDAAGIGPAVGWENSGWPDWALYGPIAQAALDGGAPILAAGLARETINALAKEGLGALGAARVAALRLDERLPRALRAALRVEIIKSHCNELPASMIDPMVTVMTARDAQMAEVLLRGLAMAGRDGAVLITGGGHARSDHGVPFHLGRLAPGETVASLGLVEVDEDETDPAAYAQAFRADSLPFDFVWFTPRADRDDPCDKFADQLRRAKEWHQRGKPR